MNSRTLFSLLLIGAAIIILVVGYRAKEKINPHYGERTVAHPLFLPELQTVINDLTRVTIQRVNEGVTLTKGKNGQWQVQEKGGYPANMQQLRKMLLYLSQSELRLKKTNDPLRLGRVGLDGTSGKQVTLWKGDTALYDVVLGSLTSDMTATYVRQSTDNQSYVASGELQFHATPVDWLDYQFISIAPARVQHIDFAFKGKRAYAYDRTTPDATLSFSDLAAGVQLQPRIKEKDASLYAERLNFTDVMPSPNNLAKSEDITTITTFDGLELRLTFHTIDYLPWAQVQASVNTDIRNRFSEMSLVSLADIEKEVTEINARTAGWIYQLGQFQQDNLRRSYLDITEPLLGN